MRIDICSAPNYFYPGVGDCVYLIGKIQLSDKSEFITILALDRSLIRNVICVTAKESQFD